MIRTTLSLEGRSHTMASGRLPKQTQIVRGPTMRINLNEFLLGVAGVSSTLLGTFIVGVFFYIDTDMHRVVMASDAADRYLRSNVRWVFLVYALPLFASLALAVFDPVWGAAIFILLSAILIVCTGDTVRRMLVRGGSGDSTATVINQWVSTAAVVVLVALPWVIGGWVPPATAFIPSILLALAAGFTSTLGLIMGQFDATAAMADLSLADDEPDSAQR
ncbi:hypothetical protein ACFC3F_05405 [Microbacterium sp. NPDC055910]|jgi:hypothetical protein|uniref:hypothetical protein n=1 Tax=Microbacterium sp. NPDC055910 TaxID=3345659 RepID=UPI0035DC3238